MTLKNKTCFELLRFKKSNPLIFWSLIIYLVFIVLYFIVFMVFYADHNKAMQLNEMGDFFAGVFSPLAFLFLFLGYKQQGRELKQNTQALQLQAKELKNSVEEQRNLVKAANEDFTLSKKQYVDANYKELIQAQPFFHFSDVSLSMGKHFHLQSLKLNFKINNSRTTCRDLNINIRVTPENDGAIVNSLEIIKAGEEFIYSCSVHLSFKNNKFKNYILSEDIIFRYQDAFDNLQIQQFKFTLFKEKDDPEDLSIDNYFINRQYESYKTIVE